MGATMEKLFVPVSVQEVTVPADLHCMNSTFPMYYVPETGFGVFQLLFLGCVYAYILFNASNLISDGSELLMLIPSLKGIVGPVVLPILGAVPDGAIVIFSGLGPIAEAQNQLSIGIGALAGSTIMLLTIPWSLSVYYGQVRLDFGAKHEGQPGRGTYKKADAVQLMESEFLKDVGKTHKDDLTEMEATTLKERLEHLKGGKHKLPANVETTMSSTGVNCGTSIKTSAYMMLVSALGYVVIQGSAIAANCAMTSDNDECGQTNADDTALTGNGKDEKVFAWIGLVYCVIAFCGYIAYNLSQGESEGAHVKRLQKMIKSGDLSIELCFGEILNSKGDLLAPHIHYDDPNYEGGHLQALTVKDDLLTAGEFAVAKKVLAPTFHKYDTSGNNSLDCAELFLLIQATFAHAPSKTEVEEIYRAMNTSNEAGDEIGINEFVVGFLKYYVKHKKDAKVGGEDLSAPLRESQMGGGDVEDDDGDDDDEGGESDDDDEEVPEDIEVLPEEQQQAALIKRSCMMMTAGTVIVLLFSDPMVGILDELGNRTGIPSFFVAFILAPLASNASELIASISYASKKKLECSDVSFGQLIGAAIMNNTFCLAIFLALICFRPLVWTFTSETISILMIELVMCYYATKTTHTVLDGLCVASLFPISIIIVYVLEYQVGLN